MMVMKMVVLEPDSSEYLLWDWAWDNFTTAVSMAALYFAIIRATKGDYAPFNQIEMAKILIEEPQF